MKNCKEPRIRGGHVSCSHLFPLPSYCSFSVYQRELSQTIKYNISFAADTSFPRPVSKEVALSIILIRTIILYMIILLCLRIMGKAELSKMSPFQLIVSFMIAELASIPIESPDVSLISGVTAIFTLLFLQVSISFLSIKSERLKNFFGGKPSVLIDDGRINHREMKKLRITINDLMEQLRICGYPCIAQVAYAVMESNGELSVIPKSHKRNITAEDLNMKKGREVMPVIFISDGTVYPQNLSKSGWTEKELSERLSAMGISDREKVFLAFCDEKAELHVFLDRDDTFAGEVKQ